MPWERGNRAQDGKDATPEGNGGKSSSECDSRIGRGRDCEIFKASQFVFGSRQRLPRPRRYRSNTLLSSNLSRCQHILVAYILQRNKPSHFCHWFLYRHYPEILIPFLLLRTSFCAPIPISISSLAEEEGALLPVQQIRYEFRIAVVCTGWFWD